MTFEFGTKSEPESSTTILNTPSVAETNRHAAGSGMSRDVVHGFFEHQKQRTPVFDRKRKIAAETGGIEGQPAIGKGILGERPHAVRQSIEAIVARAYRPNDVAHLARQVSRNLGDLGSIRCRHEDRSRCGAQPFDGEQIMMSTRIVRGSFHSATYW
jgi:hypothetical protein